MIIHHPLPKLIGLLIAAITFSFCLNAQTAPPQPTAYNQKLQTSSLLFMENKGQVTDAKGNLRPDILFIANSAGAKLYVSANAIHYQFTKTEYPKGYDPHKRELAKDLEKEAELQKQIKTSTHRFTLELQDANLHPTVTTEKQSEYTENYYLAHCPDGITGVHGYEKITYKNVYPKIDWVIYSKGGFMEYDFLVHPGGKPADIKLRVKDAESVSITATGELLIKTSLGEVREKAPVSYVDGALVETHFKQFSDGIIGFDVQPQPGKDLRIDPSVVWATYYGGGDEEQGMACKVDNLSNVYLAGLTKSTDGIAANGFQSAYNGGSYDAFIVKFGSSGNRIWATYYGGTGYEFTTCCSLDNKGNIYIAGITASTTNIAFGGCQNVYGGGDYDGFAVKFNDAGSRLWAGYYGGTGTDQILSSATDGTGNVYFAGQTNSTTGIAFNGHQNTFGGSDPYGGDAFIVKIDSIGDRLWATYYGGSDGEFGFSCVADTSNNIYMSGRTTSANGIAFNGFMNTASTGSYNAFLVKFDSDGNGLWGTYYGGAYNDEGFCCAVDGNNNVLLAGLTYSPNNITSPGIPNLNNGYFYYGEAFLVKFSSDGNRLWGNYFGGNYFDECKGCAVDSSGNIYIAGRTLSTVDLASGGFQNTFAGSDGYDVFLIKINTNGRRIWATYYGGEYYDYCNSCAVDRNGHVYLAGHTISNTGIAYTGFQNTLVGGWQSYIAKIDGNRSIATLCSNGSTVITANLTGPTYQWQIDSGTGYTNLVNNANYSGATTKNLQLTNLPSSYYGYQYRCLVNNIFIEPFRLRFASTWGGTVGTAWENPANWNCNTIPDGNTDVFINSGNVTLNSNGICRTLTVRPGVSFTVAAGDTLTVIH